ncbi:PAS domain-containing protein [Devosia sp. SL43]|uniref:PAS domain-containing protein n=1 Tax=Devosia sp. SL43 TaxID=2806348 RepID=UPI001F1A11D1|nr:PAS domain-containing protein [Devosia sp. SL43]UJW87452.1 PAS domain-containing protein [Devosia sp. SL43]
MALVQLLEHHMGIGSFQLEIPSGRLYLSDAACRIYGYAPTRDPVPLNTVLGTLIREDRRRGAELLTQAIAQKCGYHFVLRISPDAEKVRTIECFADVVLSKQEDVIAVVGTVRDISERAAIDAQAAGRSLLMRSMLINIPAAVAVLDRDMRYLAVSNYWAAGHGHKSPDDLVGLKHYDEHPNLGDDVRLEHRQVLSGTTLRRPRAYLKDRNGKPIHQTCVMCPWYTLEKKVGGMIIMLGTVDVGNALAKEKSAEALPTRQEFLKLLATL